MHLVGFITKKFVTMHGHMNVKKNTIASATAVTTAPVTVTVVIFMKFPAVKYEKCLW